MRYTVRRPFTGNRASERHRHELSSASFKHVQRVAFSSRNFVIKRAAMGMRTFSELETASSINENKAESNNESFKKIRRYTIFIVPSSTGFYKRHEIFITRIPFSFEEFSFYGEVFHQALCHISCDKR